MGERDVRKIEPKMINDLSVTAYKCQSCGFLTEDSEKLFFIHGNICTDVGGGLVGNNIDEEGKIFRVSIYCGRCFLNVLSGCKAHTDLVLAVQEKYNG